MEHLSSESLPAKDLDWLPHKACHWFRVQRFAGADVTHSRSFDASEPSVAAVVGSLNRYGTKYSCRVKIQGHRQEMIQVGTLLYKLEAIDPKAHSAALRAALEC